MDDRSRIAACTALAVAALAGGAGPAAAQEATAPAPTVPPAGQSGMVLRIDPELTLDPTAPQVAALPGGVTPAYGQKPLSEGEWRFDFHGLITAPLSAGFNTRVMPA